MHLSFGITQIAKKFIEFFTNRWHLNRGDTMFNISMSQSIQEIQSTVSSNRDKKTNELANNYAQNKLNICWK